jgi:hypothetical protein
VKQSEEYAQPLRRGSGDSKYTGKRTQHGKLQSVVSNDQPEAREGQTGRLGVAERFVVPLKPGNSGGGTIRREGPWRLGNLSTPVNGQKLQKALHAKA